MLLGLTGSAECAAAAEGLNKFRRRVNMEEAAKYTTTQWGWAEDDALTRLHGPFATREAAVEDARAFAANRYGEEAKGAIVTVGEVERPRPGSLVTEPDIDAILVSMDAGAGIEGFGAAMRAKDREWMFTVDNAAQAGAALKSIIARWADHYVKVDPACWRINPRSMETVEL
jgi:hypothetical protein